LEESCSLDFASSQAYERGICEDDGQVAFAAPAESESNYEIRGKTLLKKIAITMVLTFSVTALTACHETVFPNPDEFLSRWNDSPVVTPSDDDDVMRIDHWDKCSAGVSGCLEAKVCGGNGHIYAMPGPGDAFMYAITINQGHEIDPLASPRCTSALQRSFNVLYDSPKDAQASLLQFLGMNGAQGAPHRRTMIDGELHDVRESIVRDGSVSESSPTTGGAQAVSEYVSFSYAHVDTIIVKKR
jgi:hypothetical protein